MAPPAFIGLAGPTFCLAFGMLAWFAFRRMRGSAAELPLLYLAAFGVATFFGNMMSMAFVGDFSRAAVDLRLPSIVRYVGTGIGALALVGIQFWLGRQLVHWLPTNVGSVAGVLGIVALPAAAGTAAVILVNQPMPWAFVSERVAEASFSLFAMIGAFVAGRHLRGDRGSLRLEWADGAAAVLAMVMVRLLVRGIPFVP